MRSSEFIATLYGDAKGWLSLWRVDTRATAWVKPTDAKAIEAFAASAHATPFDAYFGLCLHKTKPAAASSRGEESNVSFMPGVWADLDFASEAKASGQTKPKNYPTAEAANACLRRMPFYPSTIVRTGGGIHAYWLFDAPRELKTPEEIEAAKGVSQRWQNKLRSLLLMAGGFEMDSTHDLSRVLRLPGTPYKGGPHSIDVSFVNPIPTGDGPFRYSFDSIAQATSVANQNAIDFDAGGTAVAVQAPPTTRKKATKTKPASTNGTATLSRTAETTSRPEESAAPAATVKGLAPFLADANSFPDGHKLDHLREADAEFDRIWTGKKKFPSPSEADMSLANYACNAGWSPEQVAALLVAFATKHNPAHVEKVLRVSGGRHDYLHLTISKAVDKSRIHARDNRRDSAIASLSIIANDAEPSEEEGKPFRSDVPPAEIFANLSEVFGVHVIGWKQTGREDEVYSLILRSGGDRREIVMGPASKFIDRPGGPKHFAARLYAEANVYFPVTTKVLKDWGAIMKSLLIVREEVEVSESTFAQRALDLARECLDRQHGVYVVKSKKTRGDCIRQNLAFTEYEGKVEDVFIASADLKRVAVTFDKELTSTKIANAMIQAGFERENLHCPGTTRSYYRKRWATLPFAILEGELEKAEKAEGRAKIG